MPITSINRVKSIVFSLPINSAAISTIYQNQGLTAGSNFDADHKVVSFNCFIKNLKAFSKIQSLEEIPLPDFELEDSETTKLYKTLDIEWQSPRKQLDVFVSNSSTWQQIGSTSLLNPSGYPFRIYNLMDLFTDNLALELGDNSKIGVQVIDVGHGLLTGTDKVVIHGSYVEEIFLSSPDVAPTINVSVEPVIELAATLPIQLQLDAPNYNSINPVIELPIELDVPINNYIYVQGGTYAPPELFLLGNSSTIDNEFIFRN